MNRQDTETTTATTGRPPRQRRPRLTLKRVLLVLVLFVALIGAAAALVETTRWAYGTGFVMTQNVVSLHTSVEGTIRQIRVDSDTRVEADQLLVQLDDSVQRAALAELQSRIKAREAELNRLVSTQELELAQRASRIERARLNLELAEGILKRLKAGGGTVSKVEIEEAQVRADLAASRLQEAELPVDTIMEKQMTVLRENLAAARKQAPVLVAELELRRVTTPIAGTVYFHSFAIGELVKTADELGQVFDRTGWIVTLKLPEREVAHIRKGQTVSVYLSAYDALRYGTHEAEVTRVDRVLTPRATGDAIFYVEARVTTRDDIELHPGMTVGAYIDTGKTTWLKRILDF
ncbi:MAG: hypothetical protein CMJ18_01690 [Phycisphaeraceae bacterium]|nr:hypothetical protein [Phycisphaeraceae bacterium]